MARDLYSLRLFSTASLTSSSGVVGPVCPAGFVYVLRDIDVYEITGTAAALMQVLNPTLGNLLIFVGQADPTTRSYSWRGRQVYGPGERIGFEVAEGTWSIMASGYQLSTP